MYSPRIILVASLCGTGGKPSLRTKDLPTSPFVPLSDPLSTGEVIGDRLSPPSADRLSAVSPPGWSCPADPSPSANTNPIRCSRSGGGMLPRPAPKGGEVRHHHRVSRTRPHEATPTDLPSARWPPAQNTRPLPVAIHGCRDLTNLLAMNTHRPITFLCRSL